jgi:hypothetical protein
MKRAARPILNQKGINKGLSVNGVSIKAIIGYQPESSINARNVNSGPLCEVVLYYMALSYLTITGILE